LPGSSGGIFFRSKPGTGGKGLFGEQGFGQFAEGHHPDFEALDGTDDIFRPLFEALAVDFRNGGGNFLTVGFEQGAEIGEGRGEGGLESEEELADAEAQPEKGDGGGEEEGEEEPGEERERDYTNCGHEGSSP